MANHMTLALQLPSFLEENPVKYIDVIISNWVKKHLKLVKD